MRAWRRTSLPMQPPSTGTVPAHLQRRCRWTRSRHSPAAADYAAGGPRKRGLALPVQAPSGADRASAARRCPCKRGPAPPVQARPGAARASAARRRPCGLRGSLGSSAAALGRARANPAPALTSAGCRTGAEAARSARSTQSAVALRAARFVDRGGWAGRANVAGVERGSSADCAGVDGCGHCAGVDEGRSAVTSRERRVTALARHGVAGRGEGGRVGGGGAARTPKGISARGDRIGGR